MAVAIDEQNPFGRHPRVQLEGELSGPVAGQLKILSDREGPCRPKDCSMSR
jgi:hypothetical protein